MGLIMKTLTIEIPNDSIAERVVWMLNHFTIDGLIIKENTSHNLSDIENSIKQSVDEMNLINEGKLSANPIEKLFNEL
jgi:hypothetical protein